MKIRVAHFVNPTFGSVFSGHTHYLFSLLSGWNDQGIFLDLFGTRIKPLNMNSSDRVYQLPIGSFWSTPKRQNRWGSIIWSFELIGILFKHRKDYEIIHFHSLNWGGLLSPLILHPLKKKVVFTMSLMGNDNPSYIRQQSRGRIQVALLRHFDGVIGLSPALVDDAKKNGLRKVICLPNFLAIPQLEEEMDDTAILISRSKARTKLGIPKESQVLLFVGSIIHRKGVDILINSFVYLAKKHPNLVLILVGPHRKEETNKIDEGYVNQLKEIVQLAGLERRVFWAGMIRDQSALVEYYRSADVFVFPTHNEGSPNVLAEAMAAYLPIVVSHLPGITDILVEDGRNGFLIEQNNVSEFSFAIERLLLDKPLLKAMGAAGKDIAMKQFGFEAYCKKLRKFYLDLYSNEINRS